MDLGLDGKVVVVTGGANGIGAAACELLAQEGAKVVVSDVNFELAVQRAQAIQGAGGQALAIRTDVSDEQSVKTLFADVVERWGTVDILVNNAGFTRDMRITKMQMADWDSVF